MKKNLKKIIFWNVKNVAKKNRIKKIKIITIVKNIYR